VSREPLCAESRGWNRGACGFSCGPWSRRNRSAWRCEPGGTRQPPRSLACSYQAAGDACPPSRVRSFVRPGCTFVSLPALRAPDRSSRVRRGAGVGRAGRCPSSRLRRVVAQPLYLVRKTLVFRCTCFRSPPRMRGRLVAAALGRMCRFRNFRPDALDPVRGAGRPPCRRQSARSGLGRPAEATGDPSRFQLGTPPTAETPRTVAQRAATSRSGPPQPRPDPHQRVSARRFSAHQPASVRVGATVLRATPRSRGRSTAPSRAGRWPPTLSRAAPACV